MVRTIAILALAIKSQYAGRYLSNPLAIQKQVDVRTDASYTGSNVRNGIQNCQAAEGTMIFTPHILAEARLLKTAEGGREHPTPPDFFNCSVGTGGEYFDLRMDLRGIGSLSPGSGAQVPIQFLRPELILMWLPVGAEFSLSEIRTIGGGKVLEVY